MTDEDELFDQASRSREETQQLREESGLGRDAEPGEPQDDEQLPSPAEPWAKTSSGDADSVTEDDD